MYAVEIRDSIMIAHSLPDPFFGPAQNLHGATFTVDAAFFADDVGPQNVVVDIGRATSALASVLKPLNYANLDDVPDLKGKLTTTEFLCRHIFDGLAQAIANGDLGAGGDAVRKVRVTLHESHVARAWYEGDIAR